MSVSKVVTDRIFDALATAFTFVAALSWRETILLVLNVYLPENNRELWSEVIVTLIITVIVIAVIAFIATTEKTVEHTLGLDDSSQDEQPKN